MDIPLSLHKSVIKRGSILHSNIFDNIGHGKFFVVIGVSDNVIAGFFFINSSIHPAIMRRQAQLDMQFPMKCPKYDFLKYDSFLCATVIQKISLDSLAQSIKDGRTIYMGDMDEEDLDILLNACRQSDLFKGSEKKKFLYDSL